MYGAPYPERAQETPTEDTDADRAREREQTRRMYRCEQRGVNRQRRRRQTPGMYDTRRWAKAKMERMYSLDGERVHPHPGHLPETETTAQRRTAVEIAQGEKWRTIERDGEKYISYTHDTHVDQRFHTATVIFPDGTKGIGLFADR